MAELTEKLKKLKGKLTKKDMKTARKFNLFNPLTMKKFVAIYNKKLCRRCQIIAFTKPRDLSDKACSLCKPVLKRLAENIRK